MKKLIQAIVSLSFVVVSSLAMAEDGSDYALTKVPPARAPQMVQNPTQPGQPSIDEGLVAHSC
jgi:hypothetical protein